MAGMPSRRGAAVCHGLEWGVSLRTELAGRGQLATHQWEAWCLGEIVYLLHRAQLPHHPLLPRALPTMWSIPVGPHTHSTPTVSLLLQSPKEWSFHLCRLEEFVIEQCALTFMNWRSWELTAACRFHVFIYFHTPHMVTSPPAMQETRFNPWVRKIPWRRAWQSTLVFLPGESCGQRGLVGYSPWDRIESDTTEKLTHNPHRHSCSLARELASAWKRQKHLVPMPWFRS